MFVISDLFKGFFVYSIFIGIMYIGKSIDNFLGDIIFWIAVIFSTIVVFNTFMILKENLIAVGVNFTNRNIDPDEYFAKYNTKDKTNSDKQE